MITRREPCTNDVAQGAPRRAGTPAQDTGSRGARSQAAWDVTLGLFALAYVVVVLFDDVESPLLSLALVVLVAYELIQPHVRNR